MSIPRAPNALPRAAVSRVLVVAPGGDPASDIARSWAEKAARRARGFGLDVRERHAPDACAPLLKAMNGWEPEAVVFAGHGCHLALKRTPNCAPVYCYGDDREHAAHVRFYAIACLTAAERGLGERLVRDGSPVFLGYVDDLCFDSDPIFATAFGECALAGLEPFLTGCRSGGCAVDAIRAAYRLAQPRWTGYRRTAYLNQALQRVGCFAHAGLEAGSWACPLGRQRYGAVRGA